MRDARLREDPAVLRMGARHPVAGGLHCKRDHLIKQDPRWAIVQNPDATRTWTTPAGLTYTKPRKEYPV